MKALKISTAATGTVLVASLAGDIDLVNHEQALRELLRVALDSGPRLVIDLSAVRYVDSNGVRMLFDLAKELDHARVDWAIALGDQSPVARLLKVTAFDEVARVYPSTADAAAALDPELT